VKRRLLNLLTALSLLLCMATVAVWVRSYFATDTLRVYLPREVRVVVTRGTAVVGSRKEQERANGRSTPDVQLTFATINGPREPDYVGDPFYERFAIPEKSDRPPGPGWIAVPFESFHAIPLGVVAAGCALPPAAWLLARRRSRITSDGGTHRRPKRVRATDLSSLVLVLTMAAWVDSATWHEQNLTWTGEGRGQLTFCAGCCEMLLWVERGVIPTRPPSLSSCRSWTPPEGRGEGQNSQLMTLYLFPPVGFEHRTYPGSALSPARAAPYTTLFVHIPYWSLALLAAVLPALSLVRDWRALHRARTGRCPRCGYLLAGNISGVCPECGGPWRLQKVVGAA
jgi:hypothetical protein